MRACNGAVIDMISKYGLNYADSPEFQEDVKLWRTRVNRLEELLGKSKWTVAEEEHALEEKNKYKKSNSMIGDEDKLDELKNLETVYMCTPGKVVFRYALYTVPERVFNGPLDFAVHPMVGETKQQYYYRAAEKRLKELYGKEPDKYKEGVELAKQITERYCSKRPCILLISLPKIKEVTAWREFAGVRKNDGISLGLMIQSEGLADFYADLTVDEEDMSNNANIVTLRKWISKDAIDGYFEVPDWYELEQLSARWKGIKVGSILEGYNEDGKTSAENAICVQVKTEADQVPTAMLRTIIKSLTSIDDLNELQQIFKSREETVRSLIDGDKKRMAEAGLDDSDVSKVLNDYDELIQEEEKLLNEPFNVRDGAETRETLREKIKELKEKGILDIILDEDEFIMQESSAYEDNSKVSHVRRVMFLANLIHELAFLNKSDRNNLIAIVKNYNTKAVRDYFKNVEEQEKKSLLEVIGQERLNNLDLDQQEVVCAVIERYVP